MLRKFPDREGLIGCNKHRVPIQMMGTDRQADGAPNKRLSQN